MSIDPLNEYGIYNQEKFLKKVSDIMLLRTRNDIPLAFVRTYGCQQNVSDGEKLKGMLSSMGYGFTEDPHEADFIIFNTCAIREHAEDRVFGNVGALKSIKKNSPSTIISL